MNPSSRTGLIRAILHQNFPEAFAGKGEPKKPLALGIGREIGARMPEISATHLGAALADYTRGPTYLKNCIEGAPRVALDGKPQGAVSALEAAYAAERLRGMAHFEATNAARRQNPPGEQGEREHATRL